MITAVQLNLETEGFTYEKWGGRQRCRKGDWLVDNDGDTYTVARDTFANTYERVGPGVYRKVSTVWAEVADSPGTVKTKEGETEYGVGDYIVANDADETDVYAVGREKFESMYEPI